MMLVLLSLGLVLVALAFIVSARMSKATPFTRRLGAALAGATGIMLVLAGTVRPDLQMPSLVALIACAVWFAAAPPEELVQRQQKQQRASGWHRAD